MARRRRKTLVVCPDCHQRIHTRQPRSPGPRAEVASWSAGPRQRSRRLAISSRNLFCHWIGKDTYDKIADRTDYSI